MKIARALAFSSVAILTTLLTAPFAAAAPPVKWVEVRSPNFVIVSNGDEMQAVNTAAQFEQMRAIFLDSLPNLKENTSPVMTVLAMRDDDSFHALLPEYYSPGKDPHLGGFFISGYDLYQVTINLAEKSANPFESVYREYYQLLTNPRYRGLPTWVSEGLADFYGNVGIHDNKESLGMAIGNLIQQLHHSKLIPLDVLLKADRGSPLYSEQDRLSIFYAESWALVQYLKLADNRAHSALLDNYLHALNQGASEDEAAKAFGDLAVLQKNLESYVKHLPLPAIDVPAPAKPADSEFRTRSLSDAEADAYNGGFLTLHNQFKEAEPLLKEAVQLDPKLALAQRNMGMLHYFRQENSDALTSLFAALSLDPKDATTLYLRAELIFEGGSHSDPEIEKDLRQALATSPNFAAADSLLAIYLAADNDKLDEALALGQKGVSLAPDDPSFQLSLAQVLLRMGRYDEAEAMGEALQKNATGNGVRAEVEQFLNFVKEARGSGGSAGSAAGASANAGQPSAEQLNSGESAEGVVTEVRCDGEEMQIAVKTEGDAEPLLFRSKDRTHIGYASALPVFHGGIEPCSQLQGHTIKIVYTASGDKVIQGELIHIQITE